MKETEFLWLKIMLTLLTLAAVWLAFYYWWDSDGLGITFPELAGVAEDIFTEVGKSQAG